MLHRIGHAALVVALSIPASSFAADEPKPAEKKPVTEKPVAEEKKPADDKKPAVKTTAAEKKPAEKKPAETKPVVKKPVSQEYVSGITWAEPKIIKPGDATHAPSDAIILFDGKSRDEWTGGEGWTVADGVLTVGGKGDITSKRSFGDCQIHLEWATPDEVSGDGQGRGNSGVFPMGLYEVQILDSYDNRTYFDGQAGSIYKQRPPLVNACRKPGEWQTYDIIFTAPKFSDDGRVSAPAYVTVLHNGVLVQNHYALEGGTYFNRPPAYTVHESKLPLRLQNHRNPMRFRNIWIREL
jgi:hypothetical protein